MTSPLPAAAPRIRSLLAALALLAAVPPVWAASGQVWTSREATDYNDARLDSVALLPGGRLRLAPGIERVAEIPQPFIWCIARDPKGRIYVGGGNDGKVIRVDGDKTETVFDAPEVEVHAIAFDAQGRLYVASSPDGRVYLLAEGSEPETFFDPDATYIWAMQFDAGGDLIVATGQPGQVYRVAPDGKATLLLDSREDHIRSLAPDGHGGFYAGSDGGGVIYRIDPKGRVGVLFDSPEREISALTVADGEVWAAALSPAKKGGRGGAQSETQGNVTTVHVTAEGGGEESQNAPGPSQANEARRPQPQETFSGAIYRITEKGFARKIWSSDDKLPLAMVPGRGEQVIVGTGGGRILALDAQGDSSELAALEGGQVSALEDAGDDGLYAATSNLGALFRVRGSYAREGTVLGGVRDAGFTSRWGAITWDADTPSGTEVSFQVRTGDTEEPDATWTDWTGPYDEPRGQVVENPPARFLQWKATLKSSSGEKSPVIRAIQVNYLPENMPPEIDSVEILDPGISLESTGIPHGGPGGRAHRPSTPKRSNEKGMRSVQWSAKDGNDDPLVARVEFKAEDETVWKTLGKDIDDNFFAWDSTAMPDGLYRLRVTVSDAPGNPPGEGLTATRESAAFEVDNTPPAVTEIRARHTSRSVEVTAKIVDSFSVIGEIDWSVDAGDWVIVMPEDGVADASVETVRFTTEDLAPGEHSIVIRARDRAGNVSAGKALVHID
ncbi:MAG TPA: hypothetical protein VNI57_08375 [Candidatus Saccharimonadales bacterium]|nr:hypothetical protein [Candidatus Saccharimonadales bacterium]